MSTRVRSWTPISGEQVARLITHHEAIEIAEYLTLHTDTPGTGTQPASAASSAAPLSSGSPPTPGTAKETSQWLEHTAAGAPLYRPTVHYAYRPCDEAEASVAVVEATGYSLPAAQHIMRQDEIAPGG
jgi:homospermidine synthase